MQIGIDTPCMYMYMKTNKKRKRKPRCNHDNAPRDIIERTAEVFFSEILSARQYFRLNLKENKSDSIKSKTELTHHSWM